MPRRSASYPTPCGCCGRDSLARPQKTCPHNQFRGGALRELRDDFTDTIYGDSAVMHRAISFLLPTLLLTTPAAAAATAPSSVDAAFGNTIVSTYPDGRKG